MIRGRFQRPEDPSLDAFDRLLGQRYEICCRHGSQQGIPILEVLIRRIMGDPRRVAHRSQCHGVIATSVE